MRVTIEIDADASAEKVFVTIRKAADDAKAKTILSYPFDRTTARALVLNEIDSVIAKPGDAKVRS